VTLLTYLAKTMRFPVIPGIWVMELHSAPVISEGEDFVTSVRCYNAEPGVSKFVWKLAGARAGGGWNPGFHAAWIAACKGRGVRYTPADANQYRTTVAGLFEILDGYDGEPIRIRTRCMLDRRTQTDDPDNRTQITFQGEFPTGATGQIIGNGVPFFVIDVSKTPPETPQFRLEGVGADGSRLKGSPDEGYGFVLTLRTSNMMPGTVMRFYSANRGQGHIAGDFRTAVRQAAEEAGCLCLSGTGFVDGVGEVNPYNGGVITFTDQYDDSRPITIPVQLIEDQTETGRIQLDFITGVLLEGNPLKPLLINAGIVSMFIQDTSLPRTPSCWKIDARPDGGEILYSLRSPTGASDASVSLASSGVEPPGWRAALEAAVAATPGLAIAGDRITSTPDWSGDLAWRVPRPAGLTGKHGLRLSDPAPRGVSYIVVEDACVFWARDPLPALPPFPRGVNLSGGEYGAVPGTYRENYFYPARPEDDFGTTCIDYYLARGVTMFRLPILWERVMDAPFGPLSSEGTMYSAFDDADMERIDYIVDYVTGRGAVLLLDLHNYMDAFGERISTRARIVPIAALSDLWVKLAERYAANPLVVFGLMNEPHTSNAAELVDLMQAMVNAIRSHTSALNRILVTSTAAGGASHFVNEGNDRAFAGFHDPAGNVAMEVHCYPDPDGSGTSGVCQFGAQLRLNEVTEWARGAGWTLMLGEFAGGDPRVPGNANCAGIVPDMCRYLSANRDVWAGGWTGWGGGPNWWTGYFYRLDPSDYASPVETGPLALISPFFTD
jgi:endoglucanase